MSECEDVHEVSVVLMGEERCSPAADVHVISEGFSDVRQQFSDCADYHTLGSHTKALLTSMQYNINIKTNVRQISQAKPSQRLLMFGNVVLQAR